MNDRLILLHRKNPDIYEVHVGSISRTKNLLFSTKKGRIARRVVSSYNKYLKEDTGLDWESLRNCGLDNKLDKII